MPKKQAKTRNTLKERKQLEELYMRKQLTAEDIAERMGWGRRTVYDRLKYHGLTPGYEAPEYCKCCGHVIDDED